jgi:hypothetical protein
MIIHTYNNTPDTSNDHTTEDLNDDMTVFKMSDTPVTGGEILGCFEQLVDKKTPDMTGLSTNLLKKYAILFLYHLLIFLLNHLPLESYLLNLKLLKLFLSLKQQTLATLTTTDRYHCLAHSPKFSKKLYRTDLPTISTLTI